MPLDSRIKKVLVIGSGPIVIGQAAEFDYAGTQACRALKEEGVEVILVNSNPATIMTDQSIAHRTYLEPLVHDSVTAIIAKEKPDGLLATLGGQTGLNLAIALDQSGVLKKNKVRLLGTDLNAIHLAEDREKFKAVMEEINQPMAESIIATSIAEAEIFARKIGFPLIIRPAFTLGGSGGGTATNFKELEQFVNSGLAQSPINQVLVEENLTGWKEIEYEIIRDSAGTAISVCNMENIDPVGVHTGDSIVVAPSQTLSDQEYQALRQASLQIVHRLIIVGGCNVQFALNQQSGEWRVIEVNPRVSRSSALASKATGYPIARIAAKIALGFTLDEIKNPVTGGTAACFEPAIDYVVMKIPRWPFDKFATAQRKLGTQMKATGEVMAIGRNLEQALLKAVRSLETGHHHLWDAAINSLSDEKLENLLLIPNDSRLFAVAEMMRRDWPLVKIAELTGYDLFFCEHIRRIIETEHALADCCSPETIARARKLGFTNQAIETFSKCQLTPQQLSCPPTTYHLVDTCAGEFPAATPFFYSAIAEKDEARATGNSYAVIGSGPIRIGQGVEFDCCCVEAVATLRENKFGGVMINNNPETVSTDSDVSDRLYFEPLTVEDIMNIHKVEHFKGVFVQFGGQTPLNLARKLQNNGLAIVGTSLESIEMAEDRAACEAMLERLSIPRPIGKTATSAAGALKIAKELGFPVLVRPSFVLGGRAMRIARNEAEAEIYLKEAEKVAAGHAILVDSYLEGTELEVDIVSDGQDILVPGIVQHIERAGVHSGDSHGLWPARLPARIQSEIYQYTQKIAQELKVKGLLNIQFVVHAGRVLVLEINPRASRTVPFLTKVSGIPLVECAVKVALGSSLAELGYGTGFIKNPAWHAVKAPVFSAAKLPDAETGLDPEMKSTGESIGIGNNRHLALLKAMRAAGCKIPQKGGILIMLADRDKHSAAVLAKRFTELGYDLWATTGTAKALGDHGIPVRVTRKLSEAGLNTIDLLKGKRIDLIVNTVSEGQQPIRDGFKIRRCAAENGVPCLTSLDTARAMLAALEETRHQPDWINQIYALQDLYSGEDNRDAT